MLALRRMTTLALALAMAASCGGDDGDPPDAAVDAPQVTAAEFDGLWLMTWWLSLIHI